MIDIYACFQKKGYLFGMACLWGKYKKVDMLPWPDYVFRSEKKWITPQGHTPIQEYLEVDHGGFTGLMEYQLNIRAEELKRKHKKETTPQDLDLAQTPELPKDWERWCYKVGVPENYIFYEYQRKGADTGYCTYCEKDVPIRHPRHNNKGRCSPCRHKIIFKSIERAGTVETNRRPTTRKNRRTRKHRFNTDRTQFPRTAVYVEMERGPCSRFTGDRIMLELSA